MPEVRLAATAVLLRDGPAGVEVLMTRRDRGMRFMGGFWVFPGGGIEAGDGEAGTLAAAQRAAARETLEEVGLVVEPAALETWSHWEPPVDAPVRFQTWFFLGAAPDGEVVLDEREARAFAWWSPLDALAARDRLEIDLAPPTWVTLHQLAAFDDVATALEFARHSTVEYYITRIVTVDGGMLAIWEGDVAYPTGDIETAGRRHRLWMHEQGWRYERT